MYLNRKTLTKLMKQVSAKHYYYIALHIITTQKQRYVPQLIVHVDIIRAECEFFTADAVEDKDFTSMSHLYNHLFCV